MRAEIVKKFNRQYGKSLSRETSRWRYARGKEAAAPNRFKEGEKEGENKKKKRMNKPRDARRNAEAECVETIFEV